MSTSIAKRMTADIEEKETSMWNFREPSITDGDAIFTLIANCPPLDTNSSYCNFLQSSHFSKTCLIAERDSAIAGFISAYQKPNEPNVLFIWQVAVSPQARGEGLAFTMLTTLLGRMKNTIDTIETTITEDNDASWALFKKLDAQHLQQGVISTFLDENTHFKGKHDTEYLYRITLKNSQ
ncbi:diaminobutyrate acetyltransferase [Photobacterium japonica]|uniref:diaminobutyrate acetyltransferase n=1 Tax=Photobacterium japonica TaxID=2910235 RepID=UPI003D128FE0